jgi:hypothetical protein
MGSADTEFLSSLFLLPDTIAIEAVYPTRTHLTVQVAGRLQSAASPSRLSTSGWGYLAQYILVLFQIGQRCREGLYADPPVLSMRTS